MTDEVTSEIRVWPRHLRRARICMGGGRVWFEERSLSWSAFVHDGIPVEILEATGDAKALEACRIAREEYGRG